MPPSLGTGGAVEHMLQDMYIIHAAHTLTHVHACTVQAEVWDVVPQAALSSALWNTQVFFLLCMFPYCLYLLQ